MISNFPTIFDDIEAINEAIHEKNEAILKKNNEISQKNAFLSLNKQTPLIPMIPMILTGLDAEKAVGIQHEFAANLILQTAHFNTAISLRAGTPPSFDSVRAAKSGLVLTKSSNRGIGKTLICAEEMFTRVDEYNRPMGFHEKDKLRLEQNKELLSKNPDLALSDYPQPIVPLVLTIRDILELTKKKPEGDLKIDHYNHETGEMVLKYQEGLCPVGFKGQFVVNIKKSVPPKIERHWARPWNKPESSQLDKAYASSSKAEKSSIQFQLDQAKNYGIDLSDKLDYEVPISFRRTSNSKLEPFMVFSDKEGHPLTQDWDLLGIFYPPDLPEYAEKVYNTFDQTKNVSGGYREQEALVTDTEKLFQFFKEKAFEKLKEFLPKKLLTENEIFKSSHRDQQVYSKQKEWIERAILNKNPEVVSAFNELSPVDKLLIQTTHSKTLYDNFALSRAGCITPFEFLQIRLSNTAYGDRYSVYGAQKELNTENPFFDPNIKNLFQHGAENRNPYVPSNLDEKMIHFYKGVIIVTHNQDQLIQLYLAGDFLKHNCLDVHFGWDMSKWGKVLEKQATLKQIDLDNPENNPIEKQRAIRSYQDYKAVQTLDSQRRKNPHISLDSEKATLLMRQLYNFQKVPAELLDKLYEYYNENEKYLVAHPFRENYPVQFDYKNYKWPIEKWAPVLKKQLELHLKDKKRVPDVPDSMKKCYQNYLELSKCNKDTAITKKLMDIINEQLDFGQRSSIPQALLDKYHAKLSEEPIEPSSELLFFQQHPRGSFKELRASWKETKKEPPLMPPPTLPNTPDSPKGGK